MNKQILIVDDDPAMRKLLEHHVRPQGYEVFTAENGEDAIRVMNQHGPSIVLTDWQMPIMTGIELTEKLRESEQFGFVYIIILTGSAAGDATEAFEAGADDFVTKPIQPRELLARLTAGQRIVDLQAKLQKKTQEIFRSNAHMEIARRKLEDANTQLIEMATTDALTGLSNRRAGRETFQSFWSVSCRHGQPLSCMMIDIDKFKSVNDTHGHTTGDKVLIEAAQCLAGAVRDSDVLCRYGGEEFLVICPQTTAEQAHIGAERLRSAVEALTIQDGDIECSVTISLGVADCAIGMCSVDDLIKAADTALYVSKNSGRNRVTVANADMLGVA